MAIITLSRKIASFGDETAQVLAELLGFKFVDKAVLTEDLKKHGLSTESLKKYDERKPGFFASLSRERDEYFDFLREIIYEHATEGNTIFIGRGCTLLFKDIPGCYRVRLVASDEVRIRRIMQDFDCDENRAIELIEESDTNREGFLRSFFNADPDISSQYHMVLNTDSITPECAAHIIKNGIEHTISDEEITKGTQHISDMLLAQQIVNHLAFDLKLPIFFLDVEMLDSKLIIHGVADSSECISQALSAAQAMVRDKEVSSSITIAHEYSPFHQRNFL